MGGLKHSIVLIGPMGAGKTTVGLLLADKLGSSHYDSDTELIKRHGSIDSIFSEHGEGTFRLLEYGCAKELLLLPQGGVISLGGGAPIKLEEELSGHMVVYLAARWKDVSARLTGGRLQERPILRRGGGQGVRQAWEELMLLRRPVYERLATLTISVGSKPPEDIVTEIVEALESPGQ